MEYIQLIAGFIVLLIGGKYLVKGGVSLAQNFKISKLVVGVTVVSFGTSAPELLVSLQAALSGHPDISIGNVIGSNISNIALVLGIAAIILPIPVKKASVSVDWPIMMFASVLFYIFIINDILQLWEGLIFVILICAFLYFSIYNSRKKNKYSTEFEDAQFSIWGSIGLILLSSIALFFGSSWLINGASEIARNLNISERVISLTIIAIGTSIPELATSITAAFKKETDISIGNIIGSNIFNIFGILGITSIVKEISVDHSIYFIDIIWMLAISLLLFIFILPIKGGILKRWKGIILLLLYIIYVYLIIV